MKEELNGKVKTVTELTIEKGINDTSRFVKLYDTAGNNIKTDFYFRSNHLEWINKYASNNLVSDSFWQNNTIVYITDCKYDDRNNKTEMKEFLPDGKLKSIKTYTNRYSFNGTLKESDEYNGKEQLSKTNKYKYNDVGKPIEIIIYLADNKSSNKTQIKYDAKDRLVESIAYSPDNLSATKTTFTYDEYDRENNWLKKEELVNGKLYRTHVRQIEYY